MQAQLLVGLVLLVVFVLVAWKLIDWARTTDRSDDVVELHREKIAEEKATKKASELGDRGDKSSQ